MSSAGVSELPWLLEVLPQSILRSLLVLVIPFPDMKLKSGTAEVQTSSHTAYCGPALCCPVAHGSQWREMSPALYSRASILVIDNDTSTLGLLKRQLENAGYGVLLAEDGIVGGHLALNASPDLILVDADMPYLNGYELVEALKADPVTRHIPVVFLTADKQVEERARRLNAEAYLRKPLNTDRLLDVVALFTFGAAGEVPRFAQHIQHPSLSAAAGNG